MIVKCDPNTKKSKCFGFIEFDNKESMDRVLKDKDDPGHTIDGRKVRVCSGMFNIFQFPKHGPRFFGLFCITLLFSDLNNDVCLPLLID